MDKIKVLIVDDEPIARAGIRVLLEKDAEVEISGECGNGVEAVSIIRRNAPDLVFLDVQMPDLDGFGVVEKIGAEWMPSVIFVTAYDKYALKAFEINAVDYLLKPFDDKRFFKAFERAKSQIERRNVGDLNRQLQSLMQTLKQEKKYLERLVIKSAGRIFFLNVEEIDWIEAADNYVSLHVGRAGHLLRETLGNLESRLSPDKFLRISRSAIVNLIRIKEIHPLFKGEYAIILASGKELNSSRRYKDKLNSILKD
ncbi:MAG TPA: response regulator [Pyrinomonadaceae bacterium]|jgi:two-component system LytT family response regulator